MVESVYQECLKHELRSRNIGFVTELIVPVRFKGILLETELRCDLFVEGMLVVELKAVSSFAPIHQAQLLTYMKLLNAPKGLLLNFNAANLFRDGQKTLVNECTETCPTASSPTVAKHIGTWNPTIERMTRTIIGSKVTM